MGIRNQANYDENGLCDNLKSVYTKYNIPVLDWRQNPFLTESTVSKLTWDGNLHPNKKGYQIMGLRISSFILQNE